MKSQQEIPPVQTLPIVLSGLANFLLGASSLYWIELSDVSSITLVAYRVALSAVILSLFILIFRHFKQLNNLTLKSICLHCIASLLIAINWGTFIWSSINGHILESGLGYLLAPFISVALGAIIYHDPINSRKTLSTLIALISVALLITSTKNLHHWTYLVIATTWGLYTLLKKSTSLDAVNGLFIETLFLTDCLALAIVLLDLPITYPSELSARSNQLIWLAGGVSIAPLLMFSYSTEKIPLSLTGFLQFILPLTLITISLLLHKQKIPSTSLTLAIVITGTLILLIAYDITTSHSSKKRIHK